MRYVMRIVMFAFAMLSACLGAQGEHVRVNFGEKMFSKLEERERSIILKYAKQYPLIRELYRNMVMNVQVKTYRYVTDDSQENFLPPGTAPILEREEEYTVRYRSEPDKKNYYRADALLTFLISKETNIIQKNRRRYHSSGITLLTPTTAFELVKRNQANPYYSLSVRRERDRYMETDGLVVLMFDSAPYSENGTPLENIVFSKPLFAKKGDYIIDYIKQSDTSGEHLVEIGSHLDKTDAYWVIHLLADTWAVKKTFYHDKLKSGSEHWVRTCCEYEGTSNGIPLLKDYRIDYGCYTTDKVERVIRQEQFVITQLIPGPVPLSEFDVAQFLPPNAKDALADGSPISPFRIFCLVAGPILIVIAILIKIRNARKKK